MNSLRGSDEPIELQYVYKRVPEEPELALQRDEELGLTAEPRQPFTATLSNVLRSISKKLQIARESEQVDKIKELFHSCITCAPITSCCGVILASSYFLTMINVTVVSVAIVTGVALACLACSVCVGIYLSYKATCCLGAIAMLLGGIYMNHHISAFGGFALAFSGAALILCQISSVTAEIGCCLGPLKLTSKLLEA